MPALKKNQTAAKKTAPRAKRRDETQAPEMPTLMERVGRYRARHKRLTRLVDVSLIALVMAGLGYGADRLGYVDTLAGHLSAGVDEVARSAGFKVADVSVVGRNRTGKAELLQAIGAHRDQSILPFDVAAAQQRVAELPWVHDVTVTRLLPDTIHVRLQERIPYALWQHNGELDVIDQTGAPIEGAPLGEYARLPLVVGPQANSFAREIMMIVSAAPDLQPQVRTAIRVGQRRWDVELNNGIRVALPETEADKAWQYLSELDREHKILSRDIESIDLRLPDRLVVRTHDNAAGFRLLSEGGEDT